MKKLIAAMLVGTMVFSLSACGTKETASTDAATEAAMSLIHISEPTRPY